MKIQPGRRIRALALSVAAMVATQGASAIGLLSGFGGPADFGELVMEPNDDDSSNRLDLPFAINFFGSTYSSMYVNNNGNVTFLDPLWSFTPTRFPVSNQPMIAPWWADVDTRGGGPAGSNAVYLASPNAKTVVVTWHEVGYFFAQTDKVNSFQLVMRDRSETGQGNFDFDFRYSRLTWTTGDASDGTGGLGGTAAQAGYDDGLGRNFIVLPGSMAPEVLQLSQTSNVSTETPGLWSFAVRNGLTPGAEPSNPLLPVVVDGSYAFDFNVVLEQRIFVDPLVAVGYLYEVTGASPSFQSVLLPNIGDGHFRIAVWNGTEFVDVGDVAAGAIYNFGTGGVRAFRVTGIETSAGLDPQDAQAFVTGLTFSAAGAVSMTQTPITVSVPEPATAVLSTLGAAGMFLRTRRRQVTESGTRRASVCIGS